MGKLKGDDDYEYGYDHLYEEEKPTDAVEDAEGPVDDDEQGETEFEIDQSDYDDDEAAWSVIFTTAMRKRRARQNEEPL